MDRAGIETWLMHVLRNIDRDRFQMDFLVHSDAPGDYDDEIRALGSRVIPCLSPSKPWRYARNFRRILRQNGPYDVVHSHVHHFSAYLLWLASQYGVKNRVAHSHSDTSSVDAKVNFARRLYLDTSENILKKYATTGLAASKKAAIALYGPDWESNPRLRIFHYSIDLSPFERQIDSVTFRREIGIPSDAFIMGHVGRFQPMKNHKFLVEVFQEVRNRNSNAHLLLVGDGPLRSEVEDQVEQLGLSNYVHFTGLQQDIPKFMMGAMDAFVMPSIYEGLPMVGIEMQAAGVPFVLSDAISDELDVIPELSCRLSLDQTAQTWADSILQIEKNKPAISPQQSLSIVKSSSFNIDNSVKELEQIYGS